MNFWERKPELKKMTELLSNTTIPTTGLVFSFGAFVYLYLSRKFYQCYKAEDNRFAKLFSYSFLLLGLNYLITSVPCLLLVEDEAVWRIVAPIYSMLTGAGWMLFIYAVFSAKWPRYAKLIGGALLFFMLIFSSIYVFNSPHYFFVDGTLNWEIGSGPLTALFSFFSLLLIPTIMIFFKQFRETQDKRIKIRSMGFILAIASIFTGGIIDFFVITFLKVHPVYSDLNYFIVFSILALTLIFTWFKPRPKWVQKIE